MAKGVDDWRNIKHSARSYTQPSYHKVIDLGECGVCSQQATA